MFLDRYRQFLTPEGVVHLKTDSAELYEYTLEVIQNHQLTLLESTTDLYHSDTTFNDLEAMHALLSIRTFYEQMFLDKGKKICYLKFRLS